MSSLMETYSLFNEAHPDIQIGKSKFTELRPPHVLLSSKLHHNVCLCKYHENMINAVDVLHSASPDFLSYSHNLPEEFLCDEPTRSCWFNQCSSCKDGAGFRKRFAFESASTSWYVWKTGDDSRLFKSMEEGTEGGRRYLFLTSTILATLLHKTPSSCILQHRT